MNKILAKGAPAPNNYGTYENREKAKEKEEPQAVEFNEWPGILIQIFKRLLPKELCRCSQVCKEWRGVIIDTARDYELWRPIWQALKKRNRKESDEQAYKEWLGTIDTTSTDSELLSPVWKGLQRRIKPRKTWRLRPNAYRKEVIRMMQPSQDIERSRSKEPYYEGLRNEECIEGSREKEPCDEEMGTKEHHFADLTEKDSCKKTLAKTGMIASGVFLIGGAVTVTEYTVGATLAMSVGAILLFLLVLLALALFASD